MNKTAFENGDFDGFIDTIRKKLEIMKTEEHILHNQPIEIPPETNLLKKKSISSTSAPRDYKLLIQKQHQMQLRRKRIIDSSQPLLGFEAENIEIGTTLIEDKPFLSNPEIDPSSLNSGHKSEVIKLKKGIIDRFGTGVNLLEDLDLKCYQRPWGKLEHELKINRAMHYVHREIKSKDLNDVESKHLRILLVNAINNRTITKKNEVNYNESTGELLQVFRLVYDPAKKYYYMKGCVNPQEQFVPPEKGENGYIARVSHLSPDQLTTFSKWL